MPKVPGDPIESDDEGLAAAARGDPGPLPPKRSIEELLGDPVKPRIVIEQEDPIERVRDPGLPMDLRSTDITHEGIARQMAREKREQDSRDLSFHAWRTANSTIDPRTAAEVRRYAAAADLDEEWVHDNLEVVKAEADEKRIDQALQIFPRIARELDDPTKAALIRDEVFNYGWLDHLIGASSARLRDWSSQQVAIGIGLADAAGYTKDIEHGLRKVRALDPEFFDSLEIDPDDNLLLGTDWATAAMSDVLERFVKPVAKGKPLAAAGRDVLAATQRDYGGNWIQNAIEMAPAMGAEVALDMGIRHLGFLAGAAIGGGGGAGAAAVPTAGAGAPVGGLSGAAIGGTIGAVSAGLLWDWSQWMGQMTLELQGVEGPNGEKLTKDEAVAWAAGSGGILAFLLAFPGFKIAQKLGGKGFLKSAMRREVAAALKDQTKKRLIIQGAKDFISIEALGATMMGMQGAMGALTTQEAGVTLGRERDWGVVVQGGLQAAEEGAQGFLVMAVAGPGVRVVGNIGRLSKSSQYAKVTEQMVALSRDSEAIKNAPEEMRGLLASLAQDGPIERALIDVSEWDAAWREAGLDPAVAAEQVLGDGRAYNEAKAHGGDIAIPIDVYMTRLLRAEIADKIGRVTRFSDDTMSSKELHALLERSKKALDEGTVETLPEKVERRFKEKALAAGFPELEADANAKKTRAVVESLIARWKRSEGSDHDAVGAYLMTTIESLDLVVGETVDAGAKEDLARLTQVAEAVTREEYESSLKELDRLQKEFDPDATEAEFDAHEAKVEPLREVGRIYRRQKADASKAREAARKPSDTRLQKPYPTPGSIPADVLAYEQSRDPLTADATDAQRWARIVDTLGDERYPPGEMEIFRAVVGDEIRPGDWVTTSQEYAEEHRSRHLGGSGKIISDTVDGADVLVSPTGNAEEAIYAPRELSGPVDRKSILGQPSILTGLALEELGERETRLRAQPLEVLHVIAQDGTVVVDTLTSNAPSYVEIDSTIYGDKMKDGVLTHNHPSGMVFSSEDIILAMKADLAEVRAVTPRGDIYSVKRPADGWPRGLDHAVEIARDRASRGASKEMDAIIIAAGGNTEDGTRAVGYTEDGWQNAYGKEAEKHLSEALGWAGIRLDIERAGAEGLPRSWVAPPLSSAEQEAAAGSDVFRGPRLTPFAGTQVALHYLKVGEAGPRDFAVIDTRRDGAPLSKSFTTKAEAERERRRMAEARASVLDPDKTIPSIDAVDVKPTMTLEQAAFHGTAAKALEKVDLSHIGTGTGIAAEGWGFYSSQLKDIADLYREAAEERAGREGKGRVLRLDVPEDKDLLDSRAPMSEQSPAHIEALTTAGLLVDRDGDLWVTAGTLDKSASEVTAKRFYQAIGDQWLMGVGTLQGLEASRPDEAASRFLGSIGIKGMHYPAELQPGGVAGRNFVIWDEAGIQVLDQLQQKAADENQRGFVEFAAADGKPRKFSIGALQGDRSTLAHELSHVFGEILVDLTARPDAPDDLLQDYDALAKWMGYEDGKDRSGSTAERIQLSALETRTAEQQARLDELTAREEKFAAGWEQFLAEGKAPSPELAPVFARFKLWLRQIYRGVQNIENQFRERFGRELDLSDDVRQIFGRMLAVDAAVEQQAQETATAPLPELLATMEPEQRAQVERLEQEARTEAETEMLRQVVENERRETTKWFKAEKKRFEAEVDAELDENPAYVARDYFERGRMPGEDELPAMLRSPSGAQYRLDQGQVRDLVGKQGLLGLPRKALAPKKPGAFHPVAPDEIAPFLGFESGKALLESLAGTQDRKAFIEREATSRMEDLYGKALLEDSERTRDEATAALHNDKKIRSVMIELRQLAKLMGQGAVTPVGERGLRALAKRLVVTRAMRESSPGRYLRSERAAGERALEASSKQDWHKAYIAREQQLLSMLMQKESKNARDWADRAIRRIRKARDTKRRQKLGLASPAYAALSDAILVAIGEGPAQVLKGDVRAAFEDALDQATADAQEMDFDQDIIREVLTGDRTWLDLTSAQAREVDAAIENLRVAARNKNEMILEGVRVERATIVERMRQTTERTMSKKAQPNQDPNIPKGVMEKMKDGLAAIDAQLTFMQTTVEMLDGGTEGVFHDAIWNPYLEARNAEGAMTQQYLEKLAAVWDKLPPELQSKRLEQVDISKDLPIPEGLAIANDGQVLRPYLWMIALNLGNSGNLKRMIKPFGWTEAQVHLALQKHFTKPEWEFVQSIWDLFDEFYPEVSRVHEEDSGLKPGRVVARPFTATTSDGETIQMRGGYFPAKYDPRVKSKVSQRQAAQDIQGIFSPSYDKASTGHSHSEKRAAMVDKVVSFNWSIVPQHVSQVIHDITHRRMVKQIGGLFLDGDFQQLMQVRLGEERLKQLMPWLQSVANGQANGVAEHNRTITRYAGVVRGLVAMRALGLSVTVPLGDLSNPVMAVTTREVTARRMSWAVAQTLASPRKTREKVIELSHEMRIRAQLEGGRFHEIAMEMGRKRGLMKKAGRVLFAFMEATDAATATPIWLASYQKNMAEGRTQKDAIMLADGVIQRLFPTSKASELPTFLRERGGLGQLVIFHGFMNRMYNIHRRQAHEMGMLMRAEELSKFQKLAGGAAVMASILGTSFAYNAIGELLSGRGPEQDEEEWEWALRKTLMGPLQTIPFMGSIEAIATGRRASVRQDPLTSFGSDLAVTVQRLAEAAGAASTGEDQELAEKQLLKALEFFIPYQFKKTGGYIVDTLADDTDPRGLGDVAGGALFGERRGKPDNIPTLVQDYVSGERPLESE